jgi:hypothetical protein
VYEIRVDRYDALMKRIGASTPHRWRSGPGVGDEAICNPVACQHRVAAEPLKDTDDVGARLLDRVAPVSQREVTGERGLRSGEVLVPDVVDEGYLQICSVAVTV